LSLFADVEEPHAVLAAQATEIVEEAKAHRGRAGAARCAGDGVVGGGEGEAGALDAIALLANVGHGAAAAQIMQQVAVDVKEGVAVAEVGDDMLVPDLVEEGSAHSPITSPNSTHCLPSKRASRICLIG